MDREKVTIIFWSFVGIALVSSVFYVLYRQGQYMSHENFQERIRQENNMTLDDLQYIDNARVFKYDGLYYIRTSNDEVVSLYSNEARAVYER